MSAIISCMRSVIGVLLLWMVVSLSCSCNKPQETSKSVSLPSQRQDVSYKGYDRSYPLYDNDATLRAKLFYFCIALERSQVAERVNQNTICQTIRDRYDEIFDMAQKEAKLSVQDFGRQLMLTPDEVVQVGDLLGLLTQYDDFNKFLDSAIRPSGKYERFALLSNDVFVKAIWTHSIAPGINTIIEQYLVGVKPFYDKMDGPKYRVESGEYRDLVKQLIDSIGGSDGGDMFYSKVLSFGLSLLDLNERDEAVRFEPLVEGENRLAVSYLSQVDWHQCQYSSILVLGDAPNSPNDNERLSEGGKQRIGYAVEAFKRGLAPVIIFSGANVYPYMSPYFEALEMKRWIIKNYGVDEKYILVEPVARHTTTNLRNASRLIFRYGIPSEKKGIIVTTKGQNDRIMSANFETRCVDELGYMPVLLGDRLSDYWLEYTPSVISMSVNTLDPLDP